MNNVERALLQIERGVQQGEPRPRPTQLHVQGRSRGGCQTPHILDLVGAREDTGLRTVFQATQAAIDIKNLTKGERGRSRIPARASSRIGHARVQIGQEVRAGRAQKRFGGDQPLSGLGNVEIVGQRLVHHRRQGRILETRPPGLARQIIGVLLEGAGKLLRFRRDGSNIVRPRHAAAHGQRGGDHQKTGPAPHCADPFSRSTMASAASSSEARRSSAAARGVPNRARPR